MPWWDDVDIDSTNWYYVITAALWKVTAAHLRDIGYTGSGVETAPGNNSAERRIVIYPDTPYHRDEVVWDTWDEPRKRWIYENGFEEIYTLNGIPRIDHV